jgi:hypothetical protein
MKREKCDASLEQLVKATCNNSVLIDAIFELLAEKNVLTGGEVLQRVRKLREDEPASPRWLH